MSERTFTKEQVDRLLMPIVDLIADKHASGTIQNFVVPVSFTTKVSVRFDGPVGADEIDSLLAHLVYYKTLIPKDHQIDGRPLIDQIREAVFGASDVNTVTTEKAA